MNQELMNFLLELAADPDRQLAFERDFELAVRAQALSTAAKNLLLEWYHKAGHTGVAGPPGPPALDARSDADSIWNQIMRAVGGTHNESSFGGPEHGHGGSNTGLPQWILGPVDGNKPEPADSGHTLILVGTGIKAGGQLTSDARFWLHNADKVLYSVSDGITQGLIEALNPDAESLGGLYAKDRPRHETYTLMAERILECARTYSQVCAAFYGNPFVLVDAASMVVRAARAEGPRLVMVPGISALDCMFVDLGLDITKMGLRSYEVHDFVLRPRPFDPYTPLVLWQASALGDPGYSPDGHDQRNVPVLAAILAEGYGPEHPIVVYEAQVLPIQGPIIRTGTIYDLNNLLTDRSLVYVPPLGVASTDHELAAKLR